MNIMSEWKVTSNPIGDQTFYRVYRIRNSADVDHSGNREYYGDYTEDRDSARATAAALNRGDIKP